MNTSVRLIGFPMDLGAGRRGVDMGPSAIRIAGVSEKLRSLGYTVHDAGDIEILTPEVQEVQDEKLPYMQEIARACRLLARTVELALDNGDFPLVLGGDHSMAIGTIAGVAAHCQKKKKKLGVIWIDAHSDINVPETSPTGNIHGMPVAVALGMGEDELTSISGKTSHLQPENLVYIGLRSVDPGEREIIMTRNIKAYTMSELDERSVGTIIRESLAYLEKQGVTHLHVSFDLDSIDPIYAPGVGTPVPGGLTYREAHLIMEAIAQSSIFHSLEIAEVNPILDNHNKSAELGVELIASSMGKRIL